MWEDVHHITRGKGQCTAICNHIQTLPNGKLTGREGHLHCHISNPLSQVKNTIEFYGWTEEMTSDSPQKPG